VKDRGDYRAEGDREESKPRMDRETGKMRIASAAVILLAALASCQQPVCYNLVAKIPGSMDERERENGKEGEKSITATALKLCFKIGCRLL
jgi:hypothetical protein